LGGLKTYAIIVIYAAARRVLAALRCASEGTGAAAHGTILQNYPRPCWIIYFGMFWRFKAYTQIRFTTQSISSFIVDSVAVIV
jgi:hypothetical protein